MTLEELVTEVSAQVTASVNLTTFVYDDISSINEEHDQIYPLLLMRFSPDTADSTNLRENWTDRTIEFLIADTYFQTDVDTLQAQHSDMEGWGYDLIKLLYDNANISYSDNKIISVERGQEQYNDSLSIVKMSFTLRVFNCF